MIFLLLKGRYQSRPFTNVPEDYFIPIRVSQYWVKRFGKTGPLSDQNTVNKAGNCANINTFDPGFKRTVCSTTNYAIRGSCQTDQICNTYEDTLFARPRRKRHSNYLCNVRPYLIYFRYTTLIAIKIVSYKSVL